MTQHDWAPRILIINALLNSLHIMASCWLLYRSPQTVKQHPFASSYVPLLLLTWGVLAVALSGAWHQQSAGAALHVAQRVVAAVGISRASLGGGWPPLRAWRACRSRRQNAAGCGHHFPLRVEMNRSQAAPVSDDNRVLWAAAGVLAAGLLCFFCVPRFTASAVSR